MAPQGSGHWRLRQWVGLAVGAVALAACAVWAFWPGPSSVTPTRGRTVAAGPVTSSTTSVPPASSTPLTVVALGDSVPAATTCDCDGYPLLVGQALRADTGRAVTVHNDATDGWTTADVESDLASSKTAADLSDANVVMVEVGANDFDLDQVDDPDCLPATTSECYASTLAGVRQGLATIVAGIRQADARPDVQVVLVGYWNVTLDGEVGRAQGPDFVVGSDALTRALDDVIATVAHSTGATYVDAYSPFKNDTSLRLTSALLDDGDHLSAKGHAVMRAAVMSALEASGAVDRLRTAR